MTWSIAGSSGGLTTLHATRPLVCPAHPALVNAGHAFLYERDESRYHLPGTRKRYPEQGIISASGIRADESDQRAKAPVSQAQKKLINKTLGTWGLDWAPMLRWSKEDVLDCAAAYGFEMHEAYRVFGCSRVSCCFCIMSTAADLMAAAGCEDNQDVYRELVALEIESSFGFQGAGGSETAPRSCCRTTPGPCSWMPSCGRARQAAEARIPKHLLYTKGWPTCIPTWDEAQLLAEVRSEVAGAVGIEISFTDAVSIRERYEELMEAQLAKAA